MGSYFFNNINFSYLVVMLSMLIADFFIGFYSHILFVYLPLFLIIFLFFKMSKKINFKNLFVFGFGGSLIFFIISNFGVWLVTGLYEKNINGLITCYILAIPFFKNTLISTIVFSYAAFFANNFYSKKTA